MPALDLHVRHDPYAAIVPFYDLGVEGFDDDLGVYAEFARRGGEVLDLGVGTGRVALALAAAGHRVVGIDRSPAMLALAARRAAGTHDGHVRVVAGEMAAPPLRGSFGLILCALNSFLHLRSTDEHLATLRAARDLLAPEGRLVLDLPGPDTDWGDWNPGERPLTVAWTRPLGDDLVTRLSTFVSAPATQTRFYTDLYDVRAPDGAVRRQVAGYALRFVFPAEMLLLLAAAGLRLDGRYGSYDLDPFDGGSDRMLIVAKRER